MGHWRISACDKSTINMKAESSFWLGTSQGVQRFPDSDSEGDVNEGGSLEANKHNENTMGWRHDARLTSPFSKWFVTSHHFLTETLQEEIFNLVQQAPRSTTPTLPPAFGFSLSQGPKAGRGGARWGLSTSCSSIPDLRPIVTLPSLLPLRALEYLAELLAKGTFFLSNRPARLLGTDKDKERFGLLNTCFAKSV